MAKTIAQNSSANVDIGPIVDVSGSVLTGLAIANAAIWIVKEASTSVARTATTSAASIAPGHYRIVLATADTDTLGELTIGVSASAALPYSKQVEVWQSTTWNLFFGSAEQILTSAAASVMVSVRVNAALVNYDVPTSADVSVVVAGVLTNYDVPTSADVSAIVQAVSMTSASVSTLIHTILVNYDVATSGDVSAIFAGVGGLTSAQVSVIVGGALTNYDVATSGDVSAIFAGLGGLTSAQVSAIVIQALTQYDVPTSADMSVAISVGVNAALTNYGVPTSAAMSAAMSAVGAGVLANYDVATSADVSAIVSAGIELAVFQRTMDEPAAAPAWTNVQFDDAFEWVMARALNRHHQASASVAMYTSADVLIASASVGIASTSANQDRWR